VTQASYMLFDVFTDVAFAGNPLAIFPDVTLDDATMQRVARELNLSETVFLKPGEPESGTVASLRIFTPEREVLFAGHPTIGTAIALTDHLWWIGPNETRFVLREGIGDVEIEVDRARPTTAWLTTPAIDFAREVDRSHAAAILSLGASEVRGDLPAQLAGAGNPFLYVPLVSEAAVDAAVLDVSAVRAQLGWNELNGIYIFAQTADGAYARMFAPMSGISEDPATGSATGPLYAYLAKYGALEQRERFVNVQGAAMGRRSTILVRIAWDGAQPHSIAIGGNAVFVGEGSLRLPEV
jgi:trans-2,3-dihydro-3-hydroxyanthranilate isomerase